MSDNTIIILTIIPIIPATIAAISGLIIAARQQSNHIENKQQMQKLTDSTNGKMDQLNALVSKSAHAEGVLEERNRHGQ